jgi:hypothetical protein
MGRNFTEGVLAMTTVNRAHARVAQVFGMAPDALPLGAEFGKDLKSSFVSDFRFNEFDKIDQDIKDVADRATRKRLGNGELVIRTVVDYCDYMVACYATNPRDVACLLGLDEVRSASDAG